MKSPKVYLRTKWLLKNRAETRDSNPLLLMTYWEYEGLKLTDEQKRIFMELTPAESITRARRELRDDYPSSKSVELARRRQQQEFRNHYADKYERSI